MTFFYFFKENFIFLFNKMQNENELKKYWRRIKIGIVIGIIFLFVIGFLIWFIFIRPKEPSFPFTLSVLKSKGVVTKEYFGENNTLQQFLGFDKSSNTDKFKMYKEIYATIFKVKENDDFIDKLFKKYTDNVNKAIGKKNSQDYKMEPTMNASTMMLMIALQSKSLEENIKKDIVAALLIDYFVNSYCIEYDKNKKTFKLLSTKSKEICPLSNIMVNNDLFDKDASLLDLVNTFYNHGNNSYGQDVLKLNPSF